MAHRNRVKFTTATAGTGPVTVGAASTGFQTPAASGVTAGERGNYTIEDGTAWECGEWEATSTTVFTRTLEQSSTGSLLVLSGSAVMFFTPTAAKMQQISVRGKMLQVSIGNVLQ